MVFVHIFLATNTSAAGSAMKSIVAPIIYTLSILAGLVCTAFIINAGISYTTSSGSPEKLVKAKKILKEALVGLVIVLSAATLTTILTNAYSANNTTPAVNLPTLNAVQPNSSSLSLVDVLVKAITGLLQYVIDSVAKPFISALNYFTSGTPLMAQNPSVFNLWLAIVAMADSIFVLIVCLLGFHIMSATSLGFEELDFKQMIPKLATVFLLINISVFMIDAVIGLSNSMISVLHQVFGSLNVWTALSAIVDQTSGMGLVALLIMTVFLVFAVFLLVYYVGRLVTLYLGAVLSPLILLLWQSQALKILHPLQ